MILGIWLYSLAFSIVPLLDIGLSKYVPEGFLTACSFEYLSPSRDAKIFMFIYFVFAWVVPLFIIMYCYFYILRVVTTAGSIQSSKDKRKTELKLALVVIGVIGLWFLAWTPYAIVALAGITDNEKYLTPITSMIPAIFCKTSACVNPYLYAVNHPRFRSELRRWLGCPIERRNSDFRTSYLSRQSTIRRTYTSRTLRDTSISSRSDTNHRDNRPQLTRGLSTIESEMSFTSEATIPGTEQIEMDSKV